MAGIKKTSKTSKTQKTKKTAKPRQTRAEKERAKKREVLLENLRAGISIKAAYTQASISGSTYYRWIDEDESWAEEVQAAIHFSEAVMLAKLDRCIDDKMDWRGWAWRLSKRFPDLYGDMKQIEMNVSNKSDGSEEVLSMMKQLEAQVQNKESLVHNSGENSEED